LASSPVEGGWIGTARRWRSSGAGGGGDARFVEGFVLGDQPARLQLDRRWKYVGEISTDCPVFSVGSLRVIASAASGVSDLSWLSTFFTSCFMIMRPRLQVAAWPRTL